MSAPRDPRPRLPFPEPTADGAGPAYPLVRMLDYLRDTVVHKVGSLGEAAQRASAVPSGWTPLELLWHLAHMERRWIEWGFLGRDVADPWADHAPGDTPDLPQRWRVPPGVGLAEVERRLDAVAAVTARVLDVHPLETPAALGGRFDSEAPTLGSIVVHVVQEYARHAGQLDVVVELGGDLVGE